MSSLPYQKVLLVGATSGIGWALAERFIQTGTSVVAVGRRKDKLDKFVKDNGGKKASVDSIAFDITNLNKIPEFAAEVFKKHPDVDCVFLNSGIQRNLDWTKPESVDLDLHELEMKTNYTSYLHLSKAFLPYLQQQGPKSTSLVFTTSGLTLVPILLCPNYCASKAAMHHMILAMREQLRKANSNVRIVELLPPAVQTELHDVEHGERGKDIGMPLKDFTDEAFAGLCKAGEEGEQIPVAAVKNIFGYNTFEPVRQKAFHDVIKRMG